MARGRRAAANEAGRVEGPWALPDGWRWERLGALGAFVGGGTPSKGNLAFWTNGTIPWVSPKDMKQPKISTTEDLITPEAVKGSATKHVPAGSVLCVMRSGILRHSFPVAVNCVDVTLNQDMRALVPAEGHDGQFIAHYLKGSSWDILGRCAKGGTTVDSIEAPLLEAYPVPVPPLDTQRRIVARIDELFTELDDGEAALARARDDLETYRKSLLKAAVTGELTADWRAANPPQESGDQLLQRILAERKARWEADPKNRGRRYKEPNGIGDRDQTELPDGWVWITVEQLSTLVIDGDHNPPKRVLSGIPHLTARNVKEGGLRLESCSFVNADGYAQTRARYEPTAGDVIITCVGTIGQTAVVPPNFTFSADRNLAAVRPIENLITPEYLRITLDAPDTQALMSAGSSSTAQPHLYLKDIRAIALRLPPVAEQAAILEQVNSISETNLLMREDVISRQLRQAILAAAFRGELVQ